MCCPSCLSPPVLPVSRLTVTQTHRRRYAGASVSGIVRAARVAKPALYYYFNNKAGLYQALLDYALDERYRLMQEAVVRGRTLHEKLVEILAALFEFMSENRELMRLAFATAFASAGLNMVYWRR